MLYTIVSAVGIFLLTLMIIRFLCGKPIALWTKEDMALSSASCRRLGYLEKVYAQEAGKGFGNISYTLHIQSVEQLTEDIIQKALLALSQKQPLLRMRLGREGQWFSYMKEMADFKIDFKTCMSSDWIEVMEDELKPAFDAESGTLWRVRFLPKATFPVERHEKSLHKVCCIFTIHHTIADGISCCHLFADFVKVLNEILSNNVISPLRMPILPPMEYYIDSIISKSIKDTMRWNLTGYKWSVTYFIVCMIRKLAGDQPIVKNLEDIQTNDLKPPHQSKLIPAELDEKETSKLLSACKKHKVTIHSFVQTAACIAYASLPNARKRNNAIKTNTAINMRPYLGSDFPSDYLGCYSTGMSQNVTVDPQLSFWTMAANLKKSLHSELKTKEHVRRLVGLPIVLSEFCRTSEANTNSEEATNDINFSNLGNLSRFNYERFGNVKLNRLYQAPAMKFDKQVHLHFATINGKLVILFQYNSMSTSEKKGKLFAKLTIDRIRKAIDGED